MTSFLKSYLLLIVAQNFSSQRLARIPEPRQIMEGLDNVAQFDLAANSRLALFYGAYLEILKRAMICPEGGSAFDLGCGPGGFTISMLRHLGLSKVVGVDLSKPMIETARLNAVRHGLDNQAHFILHDMLDLNHSARESYDLVTLNFAAHHLPNQDALSAVLTSMEQAAKPEGLIAVIDLVRLANRNITLRYADLVGSDYRRLGLDRLMDDFINSLLASWSVDEMLVSIPSSTSRQWRLLVPRLFPTIQILLGLPVGKTKLFLRPGWGLNNNPLLKESLEQWRKELGPEWIRAVLHDARLLRLMLSVGKKIVVGPGRP